MSRKLFVTRCLTALATMIIVSNVATTAEPAPENQPRAATRQEEPGSQVIRRPSKSCVEHARRWPNPTLSLSMRKSTSTA